MSLTSGCRPAAGASVALLRPWTAVTGLDRILMSSSNPVGSNAHAFAGALFTAYQLIRPPANRG